MGGTMRKAGRGWRAAITTFAAALVMASGCGGGDVADGGEAGGDAGTQSPEVAETRSAVGAVVGRGPTVEAARGVRQKVIQWNAHLEDHIDRQRTILQDVRRIAPTIVAGDSFTEGPCYDGTMPRYNTDPVMGPQTDTDDDVQASLNRLEEIERTASDALAALDSLSGDERRAAASEADEQATRDMLDVASELRRGLSQDYATLKKTFAAVEPENEELKDEIRQLRIDAGCQMG